MPRHQHGFGAGPIGPYEDHAALFKSPTSTPTTSASPTTITPDGPTRLGMVAMPTRAIDPACWPSRVNASHAVNNTSPCEHCPKRQEDEHRSVGGRHNGDDVSGNLPIRIGIQNGLCGLTRPDTSYV